MSWDLEALARIGDAGPINAQDGEVLIEIIADQEVAAIGREHRGLRQSSDLDVLESW